MKRVFLKAVWSVVFVAFTQSVFAWGTIGHRVVAEIAQRHLSKKAVRELKTLIGNEHLACWANWSDFIKSDTTGRWKAASKWHYVNMPEHTGKEVFIQVLKDLKGENLYSQIQAMAAQLKDKKLPMEQRQIALRFLIHLVGDLEQPLHTGREEDLGGNKITVYWFNKKTNLHALWDEALVDFQQYSYTEYATVLDVADKNQIALWQNSPLEDWFYESHILADKIYTLTPDNSKLSYSYNYIFSEDLNNQLLKGGVRLAKILNDVLGN
ncbi:MAG: S1/P1 nuclease [Chitinophagaceae bacterium]|jgi:hypothetical protein|nr:S1/P1 nuclease [Chitinophagaceae bacterium]